MVENPQKKKKKDGRVGGFFILVNLRPASTHDTHINSHKKKKNRMIKRSSSTIRLNW